MTRYGRKNRYIEFEAESPVLPRVQIFVSVLVNNIKLTGGALANVPPDFIVKTLTEKGSICYAKEANTWADFVEQGKRDRFGFPKFVKLIGEDCTLSKPFAVGKEFLIFPANATMTPPVFDIARYCQTIQEIDTNIFQNLDNLREMSVVHVFDDALDSEIQKIENKRRRGETHAVLHERKDGYETKIESFSPNAQNHLNDYINARDYFEKELFDLVGIVKLDGKNETRIIDEVEQIKAEANTIIDLMIDNINKYADYYNIDIHAERGVKNVSHETTEEEETKQNE